MLYTLFNDVVFMSLLKEFERRVSFNYKYIIPTGLR